MSEEKTPSLFKFKKKEVKRVGEFDVLDTTEHTFLIKYEIQELPVFQHFHKLWNVVEVAEVEADPENGIEAVEGVKAAPAWEYKTGFVKDGKYIVIKSQHISSHTYHEIHKKFIKVLETSLEGGFKKDQALYVGDIPHVPTYYANERTLIPNNSTRLPANSSIQPGGGLMNLGSAKKTGMFKILKNMVSVQQPQNNP